MEESTIRAALDRVVFSDAFVRSERCTALLRYIVEEHLSGRAHLLQGTTIAQDVFGRNESFDSNTDPIVRVQAGRLRNMLDVYYRGVGASDPVEISIPKGGYAPRFEMRTKSDDSAATESPSPGGFRHSGSFRWISLIAAGVAVLALTVGVIFGLRPEPALQVPTGPKIYVSQFNLVGDDELATVVSKGFQIELIGQLSRFKNLFVFGPDASIATSHEHSVDVAAGDHAEPEFILSGSIELGGDKISVTSQLLDVSSSNIVWSDRFESVLANPDELVEIKSSIVSEVAASLGQPYGVIQGYLTRQAESGGKNGSFDDYVCLLRFYEYARRKSEDGHASVRNCLETATETSPNYSSGWAALSWIYGDEERYGFNQRIEAAPPFDRALKAAQTAVETDPYNDMAHEYLAVALFMRGNYDGFRRAAETALSLNPNNTESLASFGRILIILDGAPRGKAMVEKAIKLNPGHPPWFHMGLAIYHYRVENFEDAYLHAGAFHADNSALSKILLAATGVRAGLNDEARAHWIDLVQSYPDVALDPLAYIRLRQFPEDLSQLLDTDLRTAQQLPDASQM